MPVGVSEAGRVAGRVGPGVRIVSSGASVGGMLVCPWEGPQETAIDTRKEIRISFCIVIFPLERSGTLQSSNVGHITVCSLIKETVGLEVLDSVRVVHRGERYLSQRIADLLTETSFRCVS